MIKLTNGMKCEPGTLIEGTMRTIDLATAFSEFLDYFNHTAYLDILEAFPSLYDALGDGSHDWWDTEDAFECSMELAA